VDDRKVVFGVPYTVTMTQEYARRQCPPQLAVQHSHSKAIPSKPSSCAPTTGIQHRDTLQGKTRDDEVNSQLPDISSRDDRLQKRYDRPVVVGSTKSWTGGVDDDVIRRDVDTLVARLPALAVR
jgi:hypothetical protein